MSAFVINNAYVDEANNVTKIPTATSLNQKRPSKNCRTLAVIAFIIIAVGSVAAITYISLRSSEKSKSTLPQFKEMEADMKKRVDPCDDFYEYSCGSYIDKYLPFRGTTRHIYRDKFASTSADNVNKAKSVLDSMSNTKDPFFRKAYTYYRACMTSIRSMDSYFKASDDIGGSPMTSIGTFSHSTWNLETALHKLKIDYNANPLFTVRVGHDILNASRNIILIKAPDTTLLAKLAGQKDDEPCMQRSADDVLEDDIDVISSLTSTFKMNIERTFATAAARRSMKSYYKIRSEITTATNFERTLIQDVVATMSRKLIRNIYKVVTIRQLSNMTRDEIKWTQLLKTFFPPGISSKINNDTEIGLMVPAAYLDKVGSYVATKRSSLPNYFAWLLLKKFSPVLPGDYFATYFFGTMSSEIGKTGKERWRACMLDTELNMPFSVGMMFTNAVITPSIENETSAMLVEIQKAFQSGSKLLPWLDQRTKNAVQDKIKHVIDQIAGPNLFKKGELNELFKNVIVRGKPLAQMFESSQRNMVQMNLKRYGQPTKRDEFDIGGSLPKLYDVNAFYDRSKNLIAVLAGILRPTFIYEQGPRYLNYAKIGAILGHELLHGFDNNGWNFDKYGQLSPWTTKHSQNGFNSRADCVKRQYNSYFSGSRYVNGTKTLGENIADNAGLKYAYVAYKNFISRNGINEKKPSGLSGLSHDQLFFVGYAQMWCRAASDSIKDLIASSDNHSPNRYRVIGSVSNFKEFSDAFKCQLGTKMNPRSKCEFW